MKWRIDNPFRTEHVNMQLTPAEVESLSLDDPVSMARRIWPELKHKRLTTSTAAALLKEYYEPNIKAQMNVLAEGLFKESDFLRQVRESNDRR